MDKIDETWADPMWRECFRLSRNVTARGVLGYNGSLVFDPFDIEALLVACHGECFGEPWVGAFRMEDGRYVLISGRCDTTIGNGCDRWEDDSRIDVQIAADYETLVRLAMTAEERERLGA